MQVCTALIKTGQREYMSKLGMVCILLVIVLPGSSVVFNGEAITITIIK
jgi:hypothetical protein